MNVQNEKQNHELSLKMRKNMKITGVKEVLSFDEENVSLRTVCGELIIEGRALRVGALDTETGVVTLEGSVCGFYYTDETEEERKGFFGRLFR